MEIADKWYDILYEFTILREGWEMDNKGWIVSDGKNRFFATTDHGRLCIKKFSEFDEVLKYHHDAMCGLIVAKNRLKE